MPTTPPIPPSSLNKRGLTKRLKRLPADRVLLLILVVSVAISVGWVAGGSILINVLPSDIDWGGLEGFSTAITFAFGVGAGLILLVELMETSDSRNLTIYQDIYEKFMSPEQIEARRTIYVKLPTMDDGEALLAFVNEHPDVHNAIKSVMNAIDYFGFLADQEWVTADSMIGWVSPIVVKIWGKIGPLVEYECSLRPQEPDYYESARRLARRCQAWRDKHLKDRDRTPVEYSDTRL